MVTYFIMALVLLLTLPFALFTIMSLIRLELHLIAPFAFLSWVIPWAGWKFASRPKVHRIIFDSSGLQTATAWYEYEEINAYGVSEYGGAVNDLASMPIPANSTVVGQFIYLNCHGQQIPITVGLRPDVVKEALQQFSELYESYADPLNSTAR